MKAIRVLMAGLVLLMLFGCPLGIQDGSLDFAAVDKRVPMPVNTFEDSPAVVPLYAGGGNRDAAMLVGSVTLTLIDEYTVRVRYDLTDTDGDGTPDLYPWIVESVHFDIGDELADIPTNRSGNPVPGLFDYNIPVGTSQSVVEFDAVLPPDTNGDGQYYVAAHAAVVYYGGIEGFEFYLPEDPVTLRIVGYPDPGDPTYFEILISGAGALDGIYGGWCVDTDRTIVLNQDYSAMVYSSYEPPPAGVVEYPENFDLVNWLINNFAAGQEITLPGPVTYALTYGDIQRAIWTLIDDSQSSAGLGAWSQEAVDYIVAAAYANGEGFVPGCGDGVLVIFVPVDPTQLPALAIVAQTTVATVPVPCETLCETAWADGKDGANFPDANQWATYFIWEPVVLP